MWVDLPVDLLIWNLKLPFLATRCQTRWVNLPLDLSMWTLTSILHVKLGKYELKSFILIWGVFWGSGGVKRCYIWHDCTVLTDCLLLKLFRNKRKISTFSWRIQNGCQIHPIIYISIMHFGEGVDLPVDLLIWNLKLPFLATRC